MKIKYLIIMLVLLICTGCSVQYDLTINEDLTVDEQVRALETEEFFEKYTKSSVSRVIDIVMISGKDYLENNNYKVDKIIANESGVKMTNTFNDFDEYYNTSEFYTQLFSDFEYEKNGNVISINLEGEISKEQNLVDRYLVDDAVINIKLPFKVISNNADNYDRETNTYSWIISEDTDYKKISLKFDSSKKSIDYFNVIPYIVGGILIVVLIAVAIYIKNKKSINNEI